MPNKKLVANAEKQKKFREKQKALGKKMLRGYISPDALRDYAEIVEKTGWTDNEIINNSLRITYAAYKNGQIQLLNKWLQDEDRRRKRKEALKSNKAAEN